MSRPHPTKAMQIDSPTFPTLIRRPSSHTLSSIKEEPHSPIIQTLLYTASPTYETFLHSPTSSEASFRQDSPILPPTQQRLSNASYPISTADGYPTLKFYSPGLNHRESYVSNWSNDSTMVDVTSPPPRFTQELRLSSILPADMDFYSEPSPPASPSPSPLLQRQTRNLSVAVPDGGQEVVVEEEAEVNVGPEVQGELRVIGQGDFMYYPLPAYFPRKEEGERKKEENRNLGRWLKSVFARYGIRRV